MAADSDSLPSRVNEEVGPLLVETEDVSNLCPDNFESLALAHLSVNSENTAENISGDSGGIVNVDTSAEHEDEPVSTDVLVSSSRTVETPGLLTSCKSEKQSSGRESDMGSFLDSNSEEVRNCLDLDTYGCYARVGGVWFHAKTLRLVSGCRSIHEVLLVDHDEIHEIQSRDLINHFGDIPQEDRVDSWLVKKLKSKKLSRDDALLIEQFQVEKSELDVKKNWEAGMKCYAVWSEDSIWYNAVILYNDKVFKKFTVKFTDYGNEDIVSYDNVVTNFHCITDVKRMDPYIVDPEGNIPCRGSINEEIEFRSDQPNKGDTEKYYPSTGCHTEPSTDTNENPSIMVNTSDTVRESVKPTSQFYEPSESTVSACSEMPDSISVRSANTKLNFLALPTILKKKFEIPNVDSPVGVVVLPDSETILVACRSADRVLKFSRKGGCIGTLKEKRMLSQPTDIHLMKSGSFLLRDGNGIQMFDGRCEFVRSVGETQVNKYLGLAESEDHIITINFNSASKENLSRGRVTESGKTDLFYFNKMTGDLDMRVIMEDIIGGGKREQSSLTNLAYDDGRLYVIDRKGNRIYCLSIEDGEEQAAVVGDSEVFNAPSHMIVDDYGTMMITDSGSNRLLLFDTNLKYCGDVKVRDLLNLNKTIHIKYQKNH